MPVELGVVELREQLVQVAGEACLAGAVERLARDEWAFGGERVLERMLLVLAPAGRLGVPALERACCLLGRLCDRAVRVAHVGAS